MNDLSLTINRSIKAPIEAVFNAWLDPEMLAKFMIPGDGMSVPKAEADAREGGRFSIIMLAGDTEMPHGGVFKTIRPHSRIVFSWESAMSIEGSVVTLNFTEKSGGTDVELTHVIFADEEKRDNHLGGWTSILAKLDEVLA